MKKIIFLHFIFFINIPLSISQNIFIYDYNLKRNIREGVLLYDRVNDESVYIDFLSKKLTQTEIVQFTDEEKIRFNIDETSTIFTASTSTDDRYFFKKNNEISYFQTYLGTPFLINDITFEFNWVLLNERKKIGNWLAHKALVDFRGREWIVWYTSDIPISSGPWKFEGLPGLIIEAQEAKGEFWFKLKSVESVSDLKLPLLTSMNGKKVTLRQYLEMEAESKQNMPNNSNRDYEVVYYKPSRNGIELKYEWEE
ncbi:GLPGLI family protein [Paenimyroides tangerinum]|uniref:GLPGLI family protein n=1 Tax=Paenimyroides tangerinum TaxID=2488728 RepID=A0A3P3W9Q0_9FLAO|nr:GLPGLI family protein [Paenimyroides tangerinum]RRJ90349.1 GLPGLI family protein [Paenimyroides tangerinum]